MAPRTARDHLAVIACAGPRWPALAPLARSSSAGAGVLTTGTFLRGLIHIGETQTPANLKS